MLFNEDPEHERRWEEREREALFRHYANKSRAEMLASAPQAEDDSAASVNDTNAALAGRYFELLKVVEQYEKSGVTCQTFRHFVSEPCAECNSPGICGKQASVLRREPVAWVNLTEAEKRALINDFRVTKYTLFEFISAVSERLLAKNTAQQAKPQPLSDTLHDDIQSVLFEVEQAIENGCCPWQIEAAFEAYEAARRLQQPGHGIKE